MQATEMEFFVWWDRNEACWKASTWSKVIPRWRAENLPVLVGKIERWYARFQDQGTDQRQADYEDALLSIDTM